MTGQDVDMAAGAQHPDSEVLVTRLVTFIVDVDALRQEYDDDEDEFDPQQAAEDFVDGLEGAEVDNHATIHEVIHDHLGAPPAEGES